VVERASFLSLSSQLTYLGRARGNAGNSFPSIPSPFIAEVSNFDGGPAAAPSRCVWTCALGKSWELES
jgi:hypothetical protein